MRIASEGSSRYDHLHGDEPEIEAERAQRRRDLDDYRADHWQDIDPDEKEPLK